MKPRLGGAFDKHPQDLAEQLPVAARKLVANAWGGLPAAGLRDYHVHAIGFGTGGTGATVNPKMTSWLHPVERLKGRVYMSAARITDPTRADQQYVERLQQLVRHAGGPARLLLLALDQNHRADGTVDVKRTEFYTPNEYVAQLAAADPDVFIPAVSVHPARSDAVAQLEAWADRGVRYVKWLPNAQNIDPANPAFADFYRALARRQMVLVTHTGKELAVTARAAQEWGNPLRLRRPLDHGVKVIMAHCASLGRSQDLDRGGRAANFDLFLRLMAEPQYAGLLFADLSAMTQINRLARPLLTILARPDLHSRLVNGSDYPLPAVNCVIWTRKLVKLKMLTAAERRALNAVYDHNPWLFDFVLKRTVRHPQTGAQLPAALFAAHPSLP